MRCVARDAPTSTALLRRSGEPLLGAAAGLFGLDESIARWGVCLERLNESLRGEGDVIDGLVEGRFVGA